MPSRTVPFVNGQYYHVFNRGVASMRIFETATDYKRFIKVMCYYQLGTIKPRFSFLDSSKMRLNKDNKIVEIICYCQMPNHFHFLLKQISDGGVTEFVSKLSNSYTKYFNTKNKRTGPILQGEFKSVHVETDKQLIHLSRYIHLNPLVSFLTKDLNLYRWSSYKEYLGLDKADIGCKEIVLGQFKSPKDYQSFVLDQEGYGKELEYLKHHLLDES